MRKIGILGGIAWRSTASYYGGICRLAEQRHARLGLEGEPEMPEIAIESLDLARAVASLGDDGDEASWAAFDAYHRAGLRRLARSGADFAVVASNTAHHRFRNITLGITIPVLSIIEVAAGACARAGVGRVLILGTRVLMDSAVIRDVFARRGVQAVGLGFERDRRAIVDVIARIQRGCIEGAGDGIQAVVTRAMRTPAADRTAAYLGCTELPLAFPDAAGSGWFERAGIRYVNSTALHVRAAFACATGAAVRGAGSRSGPAGPGQRGPTGRLDRCAAGQVDM